MSENKADQAMQSQDKIPGIVIFVAILNFIGCFFLFLLAAACLAVVIFGNIMGVYDFVTKQITQYYGQPNLSLGLSFIFGILMAVAVAFAVFYLWIGLGLLKGRKLAWYFQVAMSILGALGFPLGTLLNIAILALFFQPGIRNYFKV